MSLLHPFFSLIQSLYSPPRILAYRNRTAKPIAASKKIPENPPADAEASGLIGLAITETSPMSTEPPAKMPIAPIARKAKVTLMSKISLKEAVIRSTIVG